MSKRDFFQNSVL